MGRTLGVAKGVFGYKCVAANHRNVRCLLIDRVTWTTCHKLS